MMAKYSILIIEDELYIRDSLADYFVDEGYAVDVASSGEEALKLLNKQQFNIYIVDIRLSGMDGVQAIQKIKKIDPTATFFVFTGSLEFQITQDLASLGLTEEHVIYKPVNDLSVISDKIKNYGFDPNTR
jgi:DNA-binding response OmpR family regulator